MYLRFITHQTIIFIENVMMEEFCE